MERIQEDSAVELRIHENYGRLCKKLLLETLQDALRCAQRKPPACNLRGGKLNGKPRWDKKREYEKALARLTGWLRSEEFEHVCRFRNQSPSKFRKLCEAILDGKLHEETRKFIREQYGKERWRGREDKQEWKREQAG